MSKFMGVAVFLLAVISSGVRAELIIEDAYVRGLPPGQSTTAAFMRIFNGGDTALTINQAATDSAELAEIHAHVQRNGLMRMERVDSITIPAGGEFMLAPGGHHLMLINLRRPLREGDKITVTLVTSHGKSFSAQLPVRSVLNEHRHH